LLKSYNIRLEQTAGKSRFIAKGFGRLTYVRAAAQAGRYDGGWEKVVMGIRMENHQK